jgi:NADH dehydrogenase/NADH:ubiquinone oxidoreductase subunit G
MAKDKLSIRINGRRRVAKQGQTVLEVARGAGIEIPTLCYHEALKPVGACRVCVVEVRQGDRIRTMASCVAPVADGMVVRTDTPLIADIRKTIVTLLLARCPDLGILKRMARDMGVRSVPFPKGDEDCYLCGMCVRACAEIVGVGAIGFAHRGHESVVVSPFGLASNACIGCGTCTTICPARTFDLAKVFARRGMHKMENAEGVGRCIICETYYMGG